VALSIVGGLAPALVALVLGGAAAGLSAWWILRRERL
jgi:hypothetical protein